MGAGLNFRAALPATPVFLSKKNISPASLSVRTGSVEAVARPKIQRILNESPALAARISEARTTGGDLRSVFSVEDHRVVNVVMKLARGHAAFELSETHREEPSHVAFVTLHILTQDARHNFEATGSGWSEWRIGGQSVESRSVTVLTVTGA
jgi:hypothetical protein